MITELKKDKDNVTKRFVGKKFLIGAKQTIWDQIINIININAPHFEMLKKTEALSSNV